MKIDDRPGLPQRGDGSRLREDLLRHDVSLYNLNKRVVAGPSMGQNGVLNAGIYYTLSAFHPL